MVVSGSEDGSIYFWSLVEVRSATGLFASCALTGCLSVAIGHPGAHAQGALSNGHHSGLPPVRGLHGFGVVGWCCEVVEVARKKGHIFNRAVHLMQLTA